MKVTNLYFSSVVFLFLLITFIQLAMLWWIKEFLLRRKRLNAGVILPRFSKILFDVRTSQEERVTVLDRTIWMVRWCDGKGFFCVFWEFCLSRLGGTCEQPIRFEGSEGLLCFKAWAAGSWRKPMFVNWYWRLGNATHHVRGCSTSDNSTSASWPKSNLAEVEIGRTRKKKLADVEIGRTRKKKSWPKSKLAEVDRAHHVLH